MKVKILATFYWTVQGRHVFPGEVIDVDDELGRDLIDAGFGEKGRKPGRPPKDKAAIVSENK